MEARDSIKEFLSDIELGKNHAIAVAKEVLADGKENVTVNLSRTPLMPERMESRPRDHVFYTVPTFVAYLKYYKTEDTLIMADVQNHEIQAVLDDGAEKGREMIALQPTEHPKFTLLNRMLGELMPIKIFALCAKRCRDLLGESPEDGRDFAMRMQQITISSKITAAEGIGKKSVNGLMCVTEVKTGAPCETPIEIPDSISATAPLYVGRPERTFDIDLTVKADQESALIIGDAPELEILKFQEIEEMLAEITTALDSEIQTGVGRLRYDDWKYVK